MDVLSQRKLPTHEFYRYAERTNLYCLFQHMLEKLIVTRPENPITYLQQLLMKGYRDAYGVLVLGLPKVDRKLVCCYLQSRFHLVHLTCDSLIKTAGAEEKALLNSYSGTDEIPSSLWVKLAKSRLEKPDCVKRGWILEGFPRTREQAFQALRSGVFPTHIVVLEENGSFEDYGIDSSSGGSENRSEVQLFWEEIPMLTDFFRKAHMEKFQVSDDVQDLLQKVEDFVRDREQCFVPYVPRVLLLGPRGSGRRTMASMLSSKYDLIKVDFQEILRQAYLSDSLFKEELRASLATEDPVSDDLLVRIVAERLKREDCAEKGWVMYDFPFNLVQAELLCEKTEGFQPNRAIFLETGVETCVRRLDPIRMDVETGKFYHLLDSPPPRDMDERNLFQRPDDSRCQVEANFRAFSEQNIALQGYYSRKLQQDIVFSIDASRSIDKVFEAVENCVLGPARRKLPSKKWWEWSSRNTGTI